MAYGTDTATRLRGPGRMKAPPVRMAFDVATVVGLSAAFLLIAIAIFVGGSPGAFVDGPAIFIVIGGTFGVTTACFSLHDILVSFRVVTEAVFRSASNPAAAANHVMQLADMARRKGVLSLQDFLPDLARTGLLHRGITMVVDGSTPEEVERIMQREIDASGKRHTQTVNILRKAAEISPAMGLIGTLVGLVQMLGNLEDPTTIGPSMAVALLTTFYGAVLANLVFTPLASKLEQNEMEETMVNNLYIMAAGSIARQENPRRLEMLLNTVLPPGHRISFYR